MTNEQILKKAIAKAEKNGFNQNRYLTALEIDALEKGVGEFVLMNWQHREWGIIFSHDFCRAFWKDELEWQKRLEDMVLYKKPLKYLEQFIK